MIGHATAPSAHLRFFWRRASQRTELAPDVDRLAPVFLTVPETCSRLRVSRWMVYRLIHTGQLSTVKIGSRRLVPVESLGAFIADLHDRDGGY